MAAATQGVATALLLQTNIGIVRKDHEFVLHCTSEVQFVRDHGKLAFGCRSRYGLEPLLYFTFMQVATGQVPLPIDTPNSDT